MFHERISLDLVPLLLLLNFVSGSRLELRYISLIVNVRLLFIYFHGFQQLMLLPYLWEITSFVWTKRINPLHLKWSLDRLIIVAKGFSKSVSLARSLALGLLIVFSTKGPSIKYVCKISPKLTFLTPWCAHVRVRIRGLEILVFRKILRTYLKMH